MINLSSSVVGLYQPAYAVYAATKAGVEAMTHVMTKEMRGRNITVNVVAPGPTATALFLDGKPQEVIDNLAELARWSAWARRRTSPTPWPSWPAPMAPGSTGKPSASTAASSDAGAESIMKKVILITGASSGFGRLTAEALAKAGHTVYASMRNTASRNAEVVAQWLRSPAGMTLICVRWSWTYSRSRPSMTPWPASSPPRAASTC